MLSLLWRINVHVVFCLFWVFFCSEKLSDVNSLSNISFNINYSSFLNADRPCTSNEGTKLNGRRSHVGALYLISGRTPSIVFTQINPTIFLLFLLQCHAILIFPLPHPSSSSQMSRNAYSRIFSAVLTRGPPTAVLRWHCRVFHLAEAVSFPLRC